MVGFLGLNTFLTCLWRIFPYRYWEKCGVDRRRRDL